MDGKAGHHLVGLSAQLTQHVTGRGPGIGFAEDMLIYHYNRISPEDPAVGMSGGNVRGFGIRQSAGIFRRRTDRDGGFVDRARNDVESQPGLFQQVSPPGGSGCKYQFFLIFHGLPIPEALPFDKGRPGRYWILIVIQNTALKRKARQVKSNRMTGRER